MNTPRLSRTQTWAGILLVLATGLIHGVEGPAHYHEAAYEGLLFYLNTAGALVAAWGISRGARLWGWSLGALISAGALALYLVSRTIGLPGLEIDDEWFEPPGVAALLVEGIYVLVYASVMTRPQPRPHLLEAGEERRGSSLVDMHAMSNHAAQRPHAAPDA
jgi:hypothetical protein